MTEDKIDTFLSGAITSSEHDLSIPDYTESLLGFLASNRSFVADQGEVSKARATARTWLNTGEVRKATMLACTALIAACELLLPQETEFAMGTLCQCCVALESCDELAILLHFSEQLQDKFDLNYHENVKLATHVLLAQLKEKIAIADGLRRDLLEEVVEHLDQAYEIATHVEAPDKQVAILGMTYGRSVTLLISPLEFPDSDRISKAVTRLELSAAFFESPSNWALKSDSYLRLADLYTRCIGPLERLLEEPALGKNERDEYEKIVEHAHKSANSSLRTAIAVVAPHSFPEAKRMLANMSETLAENLIAWSRKSPSDASEYRLEARTWAMKANELFIELNEDARASNAELLLAEIRDSRFFHDDDEDWDEIVTSYSSVIRTARMQNNQVLSWRANTNLVSFMVTNVEKSNQNLDWSDVDEKIGNALSALNQIALKQESKNQLLLRQGYHWFDEMVIASTQHTHNYDRIPQVYEIRRRLNSRLAKNISLTNCNSIRDKLTSKDAVVFLNRGPHETQTFIVHDSPTSPKDLICNKSTWESYRLAIDPWVSAKEYERQGTGDSKTTDIASAKMLKDLYQMLWKDLDYRLKELGVERIFLMLGKGLRILPFHALRGNDGNYLIDDYQFIHAIAPAHIGNASTGISRNGNLLAVGNPTMDLEFSATEVSAIAQTLQYSNCVTLKGKAASKAALMTEIQKADVIHFACHGSYELELRGIVVYSKGVLNLADSKLDLEEIGRLSLPRRPLVVLSACETGKTNWHDSVPTSIGDAFISSGARDVVSTLWLVNDFATSLLMMKMYDHLKKGTSLPIALRSSQLWLRNLSDSQAEKLLFSLAGINMTLPQHPFNSPRFWAPFFHAAGSA